ncbi:MAG: hypothetical protein NC485_01720 [Ruminococcus flavefaciens]|nr:hypothetical protein [Ruminococcus flavefaciens]MCM1058710.1 hypothetical protein [Eubacterium sp.]
MKSLVFYFAEPSAQNASLFRCFQDSVECVFTYFLQNRWFFFVLDIHHAVFVGLCPTPCKDAVLDLPKGYYPFGIPLLCL